MILEIFGKVWDILFFFIDYLYFLLDFDVIDIVKRVVDFVVIVDDILEVRVGVEIWFCTWIKIFESVFDLILLIFILSL